MGNTYKKSCQIQHGLVAQSPGIHPVVDDRVDTGVGHCQPVKLHPGCKTGGNIARGKQIQIIFANENWSEVSCTLGRYQDDRTAK